MLLVVPVPKDDSVLCIIMVDFLNLVDYEQSTESVNILALRVDLVRLVISEEAILSLLQCGCAAAHVVR